ncbi:hypothetical protein ACKWCA_23560 [Maribacter sp. 2307UL18-2]
MKKLKYILVVIFAIMLVLSIVAHIPENRKEAKTTHFTFLFSSSIDASSIFELSKALEHSYSRVSADLNTIPAENIEVNVYAQRWRYVKATGHFKASGNVEGVSKLHFVEDTWLDTEISKTAIHEFVHAVVLKLLIDQEPKPLNVKKFDDKFATFPIWLWEGLSVYEAGQFYEPKTLAYLNSGKYPEVSELNNRSKGQKIYSCGYTLIEYILAEYGKDKLITLIASYGDLQNVLGLTEEEFSSNWYHFIKNKYNLK